jgi:hypothetical protein
MRETRKDIEEYIPETHFPSFVIDSTATNRSAMPVLQKHGPAIVDFLCSTRFSLIIKHVHKHFEWARLTFESCNTISKTLISSEKLRSKLHAIQTAEYGARGICAHVPTRFGNMMHVLR